MAYTISYFKKENETHIVNKILRTVADCLKFQAETKPDRNAVVFVSNDRTRSVVTFKQLYDNSVETAKRFIRLGVRKFDYAAISVRTSPEWLYAFFGTMLAGAIPVNLPFTYKDGSDVLTFMKKLQTCTTIVLDPGLNDGQWNIFAKLVNTYNVNGNMQSDKITSLKYLICTREPKGCSSVLNLSRMMSWKEMIEPLPQIEPEDTPAVFQTSGSTGLPKPVIGNHESFVLACESIAILYKMDSDSIFFNDRPFMWGGGFPFTLLTGQTRVTRLETTPPPEDHVAWMFDVLKQEKCTHMFDLPLGIHSMLQRQNEVGDDWPLRVIITGGQPISRTFASCIGKLCKNFATMYASTEQGLTCYTMVDKTDDYMEYSIGQPTEGVEMKIVDDNEKTLPVNEKGEILVRSGCLFKEYVNDPEKTRERFTDDGWYKTDDVGYMTENGVFFCVGRKSEIILSGGLNVTPSILEAVLMGCPGVARVACVPVPHEVRFQVVCACVIVHPGSELTEEKLCRYCEDVHTDKPRLFTVLPAYYMFFEKFPQTYSGKVDKKELSRIAEEKFGPK